MNEERTEHPDDELERRTYFQMSRPRFCLAHGITAVSRALSRVRIESSLQLPRCFTRSGVLDPYDIVPSAVLPVYTYTRRVSPFTNRMPSYGDQTQKPRSENIVSFEKYNGAIRFIYRSLLGRKGAESLLIREAGSLPNGSGGRKENGTIERDEISRYESAAEASEDPDDELPRRTYFQLQRPRGSTSPYGRILFFWVTHHSVARTSIILLSRQIRK